MCYMHARPLVFYCKCFTVLKKKKVNPLTAQIEIKGQTPCAELSVLSHYCLENLIYKSRAVNFLF